MTLILLVFIDRFRYNANRAAQVQSKIKGLEKLPPLVAPEPPEDVNFSFSDKSFDKLDGNFVQIDAVSFRYSAETRWIFKVWKELLLVVQWTLLCIIRFRIGTAEHQYLEL